MSKYQEALKELTNYIIEKLKLDDLSINHFMVEVDELQELVDKETERQSREDKLIAGSEWVCIVGHENDAAGIYEGQRCFITSVSDSHVWFGFKEERYSSGCDFGDSKIHFLLCYKPKE